MEDFLLEKKARRLMGEARIITQSQARTDRGEEMQRIRTVLIVLDKI